MCKLLLSVLILSLGISAAQAEKPNIILIMCDDMGFSDIGCYGGEVKTPHIDRLAREGIRFTQFYNNAKCTTTRASLITGLYPRRQGGLLNSHMVTIPQVLKSAGYQSALSGKWHLGSSAPNRPSDRGFDRYWGLLDGCSNLFNPIQPDPKFKGGRVRVVKHDDELVTSFPEDFYMTDKISQYAVECIEEFSKSDAPFFLHVCYTAPHYPLHAKPEDIARYRGQYRDGWELLRKKRHHRQIEMGLIDPQWKAPERDREVVSWEDADHKEWQDLRMAVYAAMIDSTDQGIGKILARLDERQLRENSIVMFLSDNGGCAERPGGDDPNQIPGPKEFYAHCGPGWAWAQNTPFRRYKQFCHEGGISTPLIVRWPGIVKPNHNHHTGGTHYRSVTHMFGCRRRRLSEDFCQPIDSAVRRFVSPPYPRRGIAYWSRMAVLGMVGESCCSTGRLEALLGSYCQGVGVVRDDC